MKRSVIKSLLFSSGVSQREVLNECNKAGIDASLAKINIALDEEFCNQVQDIAKRLANDKISETEG